MKNQNIIKRFKFALDGLRSAWQSEKSFRAQIVMTFIVIASLFYLKASPQWWASIMLVIGATLAAELINTSMEYMLDLLHPNFHSQIGRAKDCAAAAVLVLSISAIIIFSIFIYEKLT